VEVDMKTIVLILLVAVQSIEDRIRVENKVWFGDIVGERRRSTSHEPTEKRLT